jgi:hypothetical protein
VFTTINFRTTLNQVDSLIAEARSITGFLELRVTNAAARIDTTARRADEVIEALHGFSKRAEHLVTEMETMQAQNEPELRAVMNDLAAASRSLRALLDYLDRNPRALIFGKKD